MEARRECVAASWARPVLRREALFTRREVQDIVSGLARKISDFYRKVEGEMVVVGLLDGVFMFVADLSRDIEVPHVVDFVVASSYGANTVSSGNVKIKKDASASVRGKHVLIVDDICDSGRTLASLAELFRSREAASVRTCCLLDKTCRRVVDVQPDYVGAVIDDHFVVGYGMDWDAKYRSLPFIGIVKPHLYDPAARVEEGDDG